MKLHTTISQHPTKNCIVVASNHQAYIYNTPKATTAKEIAALIIVLSKKESSPSLKNHSDSQ